MEEKIRQYKIDGEIVLTTRSGHATELSAAYYEKGYGHIIAVGGDGTMNEVAIPLLNKPGVITGIIPAGTGNDFNQILGFPDRFEEEHFRIFFENHHTPMDVGSCNDSWFLNGMGLGFDAEVAAKNYTTPDDRKKGGKGKYIWHILSTLFFYKEKRMLVKTVDGTHESDCFINTVSIGRRFAGGFYLTPKAIANDGLLDVCNIKRLNLYHRLRILMMVPKGTHVNDRFINYFQTTGLNLAFPKEMPYHVDGELGYGREFKIRIHPGFISMMYNPLGPHYFENV